MGIVAVAVALFGRAVPALLAGGVGLIALVAWRMSRDLTPLWLEIDADALTVQTRSTELEIPLAGSRVHRLDSQEISHVQQLAEAGGIVAGLGGFDSHLLGEFDLYASDLQNAVLVDGGELRMVVTPDSPTSFCDAAAAAGAHLH
jgi:hypothetical protein